MANNPVVAILEDAANERRVTLGPRMVIGRSGRSDVCVDDRRVSAEHATISWVDDHWEIRDLGSRNGTSVNGTAVEPRRRVAIGAGDAICFGSPEHQWIFRDDHAPGASAFGGEARAEGSLGLLLIPNDQDPRACVMEEGSGWCLEYEGERRLVADQDSVVIDGRSWVLNLPSLATQLPATQTDEDAWHIDALSMHFRVSRDEEHVRIQLMGPHQQTELPERAFSYLLLTLARRRLDDRSRDDLPMSEEGWMGSDDLCGALRIEPEKLNVDVYRARKQLERAGIAGSAGLIERRRASGELRIGVSRLEVQRV
jgi:hypothetical protein